MTNQKPEERIVDIDLRVEMQESFLEYSYSVIYARAMASSRCTEESFIKWEKWDCAQTEAT